ncbi:multidrug effflux MFS transporter [Microbacterium pygmaeum]|uniref:MFS transporter, DHA1 family, bicyclomycin/chloramphenicol resistance protein n=1 Tax=Microbacterium pygmaeum TaxID=370764 RepID=A0A1G7VGZ9_9MICO|nr:multidrug effflux MFS transporter [Microbacterium pygmaeum]SDG58831.1 MFS transporter, DHA1 family, bicyclomycin/chloramphenicol resistance protein [Microbacterium pygmaeum]
MTSPTAAARTSISWLQLWTLALLAAVSPLATGMYLAAIPQMRVDLAASTTGVQLTITGFLAGLAVGQLVIGAVSDRTGRRAPLLVAGVACVLASAVCALAPTIEVLVAARFVQGFAGAAGIVLGRAIVADRADGTDSARVFSLLMTIGAVAPVLAPLLGGAILQSAGWREIFWVLTGIAVLMLAGSFFALPESLPAGRRAASWRVTWRDALAAASHRPYLGYTLCLVFSYSVLIAYVTGSPFVLQIGFGLTPLWYAVVFAANALGLTLGSLLNARLVRRVAARRLLSVGVVVQLSASGALLLLAAADLAGLPVVLVLLWVSVTALGFIAANATSLALGELSRGLGAASALLGAAQFGVAALAAPLVGIGGEVSTRSVALVMTIAGTLGLASLVILTRTTSAR